MGLLFSSGTEGQTEEAQAVTTGEKLTDVFGDGIQSLLPCSVYNLVGPIWEDEGGSAVTQEEERSAL